MRQRPHWNKKAVGVAEAVAVVSAADYKWKLTMEHKKMKQLDTTGVLSVANPKIEAGLEF
jgi:hypothetical protein